MAWLSFGKQDIGEELNEIYEVLYSLQIKLASVEFVSNLNHILLKEIMALVQIEQSVLDAFGETLETIVDEVQAIVDDESNPLTDADVSGIIEGLTKLEGILAQPETPVEPEPVEPDPGTPEVPVEPPVEPEA